VINFRFHLVSLVAVFLALALGVVMGSTLVDRAIVDGLRSRIDTVESNADSQREENLRLKQSIDVLRRYSDEALPHLVGTRLAGVSLSVVAVRGVSDGTVRTVTEALRASGAKVPGVLWLEPGFALKEPADEKKLSGAVTDPYRKGPQLREAALDALGRRLAGGPNAAIAAAPPVAPQQDVLQGLETARFVAFEAFGGPPVDLRNYPDPGSRLLVLDGPEGKVPTVDGALPLIRSASTAGALTLLAEVFRPSESGPGRGSVVETVRGDATLKNTVATVDDVDETAGQAAIAFAMEELGTGKVGHYGIAPGATRQIPEAPPPALPVGPDS
jgi:hypothetical protein